MAKKTSKLTRFLSESKIIPKLEIIFALVLFFVASIIYLFPLMQGLILLPLDLLISNYHPWYSPGQILLKNPYMQDSIVQLFPWRHLVFQSLSEGIIPFWNPYQHAGMPFMAAMKPMVFYPFNIFFIFGEVNAWHALLFSQLFLSMVFSYMLAKEFKLSFYASVIVGFAFSLSSLMVGVLEFGSEGHVLLWLPLLIFCAKRYFDRKESKYLVMLGLFLAVSILAGQLQYSAYCLIVLSAFIIYYSWIFKKKIIDVFFLASSIVLGVALSAFQLIPSIELFSLSYRGISRSYEVFASELMPVNFLLRLFSPDFFGNPTTHDLAIGYIETSGYLGVVPFFFCLYAILFARKNKYVIFLAAIFVAGILLSLNGIGQILYFLNIPLITSGTGIRIFFIALFSGAFLAGFGVDEFVKSGNVMRKILSLAVFISIFALGIVFQLLVEKMPLEDLIKNVRFTFIIFVVFSFSALIYLFINKKFLSKKAFISILFLFFVVGLTYFDLFRMGYRFLTFSNEKFLYPVTDVVEFVKNESETNLTRNIGLTDTELATYLNVYTVETYNPLYIRRTGMLFNALQGKNDDLPKNKYFIAKGGSAAPVLDFLGVSHIVVGKDVNPSSEILGSSAYESVFDSIYKGEKHSVYVNKNAFPRFDLIYEADVVSSDEEMLKLVSRDPYSLANKILIEEKLPINISSGSGSLRLLSSTLNTQKFEVETDKPALLYVSDTYFPGWKAYINNKEAKIYRANYNFRAVLVPAGKSLVEFSYLPSGFKAGVVISLISLLLLISVLLWHKIIYNFLSDIKIKNKIWQ